MCVCGTEKCFDKDNYEHSHTVNYFILRHTVESERGVCVCVCVCVCVHVRVRVRECVWEGRTAHWMRRYQYDSHPGINSPGLDHSIPINQSKHPHCLQTNHLFCLLLLPHYSSPLRTGRKHCYSASMVDIKCLKYAKFEGKGWEVYTNMQLIIMQVKITSMTLTWNLTFVLFTNITSPVMVSQLI